MQNAIVFLYLIWHDTPCITHTKDNWNRLTIEYEIFVSHSLFGYYKFLLLAIQGFDFRVGGLLLFLSMDVYVRFCQKYLQYKNTADKTT